MSVSFLWGKLLSFPQALIPSKNFQIGVIVVLVDLKNFQKESHDKLLVPIAVVTEAEEQNNIFEIYDDRVAKPLFANRNNLNEVIASVITKSNEKNFNYGDWEKSIYLPTPTIVEAAQSLYAKHSVEDIARSDAGAQNLTTTTKAIEAIIEKSKATGEKSIIFVTGVVAALTAITAGSNV